MSVQMISTFTDSSGVNWARMSNGHKVRLPGGPADLVAALSRLGVLREGVDVREVTGLLIEATADPGETDG